MLLDETLTPGDMVGHCHRCGNGIFHCVRHTCPPTVPKLNEIEALRVEIGRLKAAMKRARNILHAHNRPVPLPNDRRVAARDILDLALEER